MLVFFWQISLGKSLSILLNEVVFGFNKTCFHYFKISKVIATRKHKTNSVKALLAVFLRRHFLLSAIILINY
ncbi:hypothetical protein EC396_14530 [Lutibacter sp. HS1-25]|nr:hypothetical protein EC396_14530 [Lutibacter sp. HS1-25]